MVPAALCVVERKGSIEFPFIDELAGLPQDDLEQLKACLKNFDFAAAHSRLTALTTKFGIIFTSNHKKE